ncbi:DNA (cytosine-5-)-methyltransferase [Spiroplasma floricola]|uniref:Cytosine-specific methyltransferase n=1 Tax=Spiroplasma floricola 23-6 TaxID=1336749 RepID=A0A2K8SEB4_9MOLU|nr:DNA (cytosine-5-)-methyltransferase [Spiroplasma floricola]AUB31797.1 DNA (cytosine-5)-methyltransferase 1 [Spiroplasma floricola 23-6]
MSKLRVFETFAGIGAQHKALEILKKNIVGFDYEIAGTSEWDIWANLSYNAIHHNNKNVAEKLSDEEINNFITKYTLSNDGKKPIDEKFVLRQPRKIRELLYSSLINCNNQGSILEITGNRLINNIGDFDLLTYSFPCQDLSVAGSFHGFNQGMAKGSNTRSGLLWEIERILKELKKLNKLPKYLLLENVKNMISNKHKDDYIEWLEFLASLGYETKTYILDASKYGIPQKRKRVFAISILKDEEILLDIENFINDSDDIEDVSKEFNINKQLKKILKVNYSIKKYEKEAKNCSPNNTPSRRKMYKENPKVFQVIKGEYRYLSFVRTITTKQDRHPNAGIVVLKETEIIKELEKTGKSNYRFLTPRETFLLMGFTEEDFEKATVFNQRKDILYRQAGNSIVVNVLVALFNNMMKEEKN